MSYWEYIELRKKSFIRFLDILDPSIKVTMDLPLFFYTSGFRFNMAVLGPKNDWLRMQLAISLE